MALSPRSRRFVLLIAVVAGACSLPLALQSLSVHGFTAVPTSADGPSFRQRPFVLAPYALANGDGKSREFALALVQRVGDNRKVYKVNDVLHSLLIYGIARHESEEFEAAYQRALRLLCDRKGGSTMLPNEPWRKTGLGYQAILGEGAVAHADQDLKIFGESNEPSTTTIDVDEFDRCTLETLLRSSARNFSIHQELEFTAVAFALWLDGPSWTNRYGESWTFNDLVDRMVAAEPGKTACNGIHTLYALTIMLRRNEISPILDPAHEASARGHLARTSALLSRTIKDSRLWYEDWHKDALTPEKPDNAFGAIGATGHHLEWLSLCPPELRPSDDILKGASEALIAAMQNQHNYVITNNYAPFCHAVRGVLLLDSASSPSGSGRTGGSGEGRPAGADDSTAR